MAAPTISAMSEENLWAKNVNTISNANAINIKPGQPRFNVDHFRTVRGILQVTTIVLTFVGTILARAAESSLYNPFDHKEVWTYPLHTAGYAVWISVSALIQTALYLAMNLFCLNPFLILELLITGLWTVLLFIGGCVLIPFADEPVLPTRAPAAAFCFAASLTMGANWGMKFRTGRASGALQAMFARQPLSAGV